MKRTIVWLLLALLVAGIGALAWTAAGGEPVPSVRPTAKYQPALYRRVAEAAQHRRVLQIRHQPGKKPSADILVSGRTGAGWSLFPAAPPEADWLADFWSKLAQALADDWVEGENFHPDSVQAMERLDIKLVFLEDGQKGVELTAPHLSPKLRERPEVPALEIRYAEPMWHLLNEKETAAPTPELAFARGLRVSQPMLGAVERDLWSVAATVTAPMDATYLVTLPAQGGTVLLDGKPIEPGQASLPFVTVPLAKGKHRLEVTFEQGAGRDAVAIFGAAAVVLALIGLLLALRPTPTLPPPPEPEDEPVEAEPPPSGTT